MRNSETPWVLTAEKEFAVIRATDGQSLLDSNGEILDQIIISGIGEHVLDEIRESDNNSSDNALQWDYVHGLEEGNHWYGIIRGNVHRKYNGNGSVQRSDETNARIFQERTTYEVLLSSVLSKII